MTSRKMRRQRAFDEYVRVVKRRATPGEAAPTRDAWLSSHPAGFVEYVDALGPRGKYGRWLRSHKVVHIEGGTAFMHAGVRPDMSATFNDINRTAARDIMAWDDTKATMVKAQIVPAFCTLPEAVEAAVAELQRISAALKANAPPGDHVTREFVDQLQALLAVGKSSLFEPEGPLWFRGFALWPETRQEISDTMVTPILNKFGVDRFVTGHTPSQTGRIVSRFNNRLILIDTGMLTTTTRTAGPRHSSCRADASRRSTRIRARRSCRLPPPTSCARPSPPPFLFRRPLVSALPAAVASAAWY